MISELHSLQTLSWHFNRRHNDKEDPGSAGADQAKAPPPTTTAITTATTTTMRTRCVDGSAGQKVRLGETDLMSSSSGGATGETTLKSEFVLDCTRSTKTPWPLTSPASLYTNTFISSCSSQKQRNNGRRVMATQQ